MKPESSVLVGILGAFLALPAAADRLELIELPDGFRISVYAERVDNARQMALGDQGTLFVGSRKATQVYALRDDDGDHVAERVVVLDRGLEMPSGVAFRDGALYVGDHNRILRYDLVESRIYAQPDPILVTDQLPRGHHNWKHLEFGPDGWLYIPVGVPCNICDEQGYGQIRRLDLASGNMEVYARGIRNSVGFTFHPETGDLWFNDNGRDHLGDELPADELNHAPRPGMHFGFPYCHQGDLPDPEYGPEHDCDSFIPPALNYRAHVAPLGMAFYTGDMFPAEYRSSLFVAQHGSWNRSSKIGYRLVNIRFDASGAVTEKRIFASGWLQGERAWGRPVDVLVMPDGALLVSDDEADLIYRITWSGEQNRAANGR
ncbi:MAG: PQQ-dependent sugar dehydrogenase [Xanthomonadales bacterium]|nr:PQQ-dependent sugar dehydrogenase [Xanthomonadales bacterium]